MASTMISWQNFMLIVLMIYDLSSWRNLDSIIITVFAHLSLPFLGALSNPSDKNTTCVPEMNILSFKYLLKYFSNNLLYFCSYLLIFTFYWKSQYYQPLKTYRIVKNNGWLQNTHSNCIFFLLMNTYCFIIPLNCYDSHPWK